MGKPSWREEAWESFLIKFWDERQKGSDSVEYTTKDLEPFLSRYGKSGQGEIRIFHYGCGRVEALKKRNLTKIPLSHSSWKLIPRSGEIIFPEPGEGILFFPKNKMTDGMIAGIKDAMERSANPGETTFLTIANHSGIISDFYDLKNQGTLFTGGRQRAGIHLVLGCHDIDMTKAQIEIDGGFEWTDTVVIAEMKSSFKQDHFDINQALIPMLKWKQLLKNKRVYSLVLLAEINSKGIEYWMYDLDHVKTKLGNSMRIVKSKKYMIEVK